MELSSFSENIVTVSFRRNGETVELQFNIDAIVPDYYQVLDERLAPLLAKAEELQNELDALADQPEEGEVKPSRSLLQIEKDIAEIQREAYAERLTCPVSLPDGTFTALLKDWSLTENGIPLPASKEVCLKLPPRAVKEMYERAMKSVTAVKKREDEETEETLGSMPSGSREHLALAPTG